MKRCLVVLFMATLLFSCQREEFLTTEPDKSVEASTDGSGDYIDGEVRVFFTEEMTAMVEEAALSGSMTTKSSGMNSALDELGITEMRRLFPHAGEFEERTRAEGLHRWYVIRYSKDVTLTKAQDCLGHTAGVEIFEPVRKIRIHGYNDPMMNRLWGLDNRITPSFDINVVPVWENYTSGNPNVIVAVVDEGVDLRHEDLADNCLSEGHYNAVNDNSYIMAGEHGTHVAGTIAAVSNNGKGIAGIAGGDKKNGQAGVKIMSCQIFMENADGTTSSAGGAAAIKWGADHGAVISQNSWGYTFDKDGDGKLTGDELNKALNARIDPSDKAAVDYFNKYAGCDKQGNQLPGSPMKGGVVIFAAGNDGISMGAPAEYDGVIAVGAVASDGSKSSFSNYGDWVDICAPGSDIVSTLPNNRYVSMDGTSMACPHVSGVAALIVSHFGGPGFTNEMLKDKLLSSANTAIISQAYQIGGLVDTYGAFVYGNDKAPSQVTDLEVSGRGNNIDLKWTVTGDADGKPAYGFLVIYGKDKSKVEAATYNKHDDVSSIACMPGLQVGEKAEFVVSRVDFESQYYVKMLAYSYGRSYSNPTDVYQTNTTENHPPVINIGYDDELRLMPFQTLNIPIEVSDPDDHSVELSHQSGSAAETLTYNPLEGTWRLSIKGSDAPEGTYELKLIATDEFGTSSTLALEYVIRENAKPEKIKEVENVLLTAKGREFIIDLLEYVTDPDGEQLKYSVTVSDPTVVHLNPKGDKLIGTALGYGTADVTLVAKDARGESVTFEFKVQVKDPSNPVTVYPNPVKDYVNVGTLDMAETTIRIYGSTGNLVHEETSQVSGLEPARIDMRNCAPGVYTMSVMFSGKEYKETVVKL